MDRDERDQEILEERIDNDYTDRKDNLKLKSFAEILNLCGESRVRESVDCMHVITTGVLSHNTRYLIMELLPDKYHEALRDEMTEMILEKFLDIKE